MGGSACMGDELDLDSHQIPTAMTKPFDALYLDLEKALKIVDRKYAGAEKYVQGMTVIRERIGQLRIQGARFIKDGAREVEYFRHVWPVFYAKLFLHIWLYRMELTRVTVPDEGWPDLVEREERRVVRFFRVNQEF